MWERREGAMESHSPPGAPPEVSGNHLSNNHHRDDKVGGVRDDDDGDHGVDDDSDVDVDEDDGSATEPSPPGAPLEVSALNISVRKQDPRQQTSYSRRKNFSF